MRSIYGKGTIFYFDINSQIEENNEENMIGDEENNRIVVEH